MEQGNKVVLAIIVGALVIGIAIFLSFGIGNLAGQVVRGEVGEEIVHFDGNYNCGLNVYNCGSFDSRVDAQDVFDDCGGVENDVHALDGDGDGFACEGLR